MNNRLFCLLIFFCALVHSSGAQQEYAAFQHLTIDDGLSSNTINAVYRDTRGYLWIGTPNGLNQYDGYVIKNFLEDKNDAYSLKGNIIYYIIEDKRGNIWIGTDKALNKYDILKDKFYHFLDDPTSHLGQGATKLLIDSKGIFWIGNEKGLLQFDEAHNTTLHYEHNTKSPFSISGTKVRDIYEDKEGWVWIATDDNSICRYNRKSDNFTIYKFPTKDKNLNQPASSLISDNEGQIWICSKNTLAKFNKKTGKFTSFSNKQYKLEGPFNKISADKFGNIWISSLESGLYKYDALNEVFTNYRHLPYEIESLSESRITTLYFDNESYLWAGTVNKGLNRLDLNIKNIIFYDVTTQNSLKTGEVYCLKEDFKKNIWIGSNSGLEKLDTKNNIKQVIYQSKYNDKNFHKIIDLYNGNILAIANNNIYEVNSVTLKSKIFSNKYLINELINSAYKDSNGHLWISVGKYIYLFKNGNLEAKPIVVVKSSTTFKEVNLMVNFFEENDFLWISIEDELFKIDKRTLKYKNILNHKIKFWENTRIVSLDKKGSQIRIATTKNICFYEENTGKLIKQPLNFLSKDELAPVSYFYDDSNLCIITYRGIYLYNVATKKFLHPRIFNSDKINSDIFIKASSGYFFLAAGSGFISFNPKEFKEAKAGPKIIIADLYLFNKKVRIDAVNSPLTEKINETYKIEFDHKQNVFSFDLSLLTLDEVQKNQYAYMLDGFEDNWNFTGNRKMATYTNIPSGKYTFRYRGKDKNGNWSDFKSLDIIIHPPFWEEWWFRLLGLLGIGFIIFGIFKYRINVINRQKIELESLVKERTAEISIRNEEITLQKEEIGRQQEKISELYEEVTQSIHTAQRIQESYLPPDALIKKYLPDSFVLYLPKDIVSGDFYWLYVKYDKIYLAAVDCTGHGVAGAFMSIIGNNLLTRIVAENSTYNAGEILDKLSIELITTLHQDTDVESSREGMDMNICIIDPDENNIHFAGANNPLYIVRNKEIIQIKADKRGIGLQKGNKNENFTNQVLELVEGDKYYLFSDGFPSQFGGMDGMEKMKFNRFRDIIIEISDLPFNEQLMKINKKLKTWQGDTEQTDDIMILGFSVPKKDDDDW